MACIQRPEEDHRRLQRHVPADRADGQQGNEAAALAAALRRVQVPLRRGERGLLSEGHPHGAAAAVQGGYRGVPVTVTAVGALPLLHLLCHLLPIFGMTSLTNATFP